MKKIILNIKRGTKWLFTKKSPHKLSELQQEQANETDAVVNELEGQRVLDRINMNFG